MQTANPVLSKPLMDDSSQTKVSARHLINLLVMILLAAAVGLGVALVFIAQPQDLNDIGGYGLTAKADTNWNMKTVLQSALDRNQPLTLTERHINQWLNRTLVTKQAGLLAGIVSLERLWVRLENGHAEVIMERRIMGHPFTVSMFLKVEQTQGPKGVLTQVQLHGGPYLAGLPQPPRGGRFGTLVVPQGFLLLVLPAYQKLVPLFHDEIRLGFEEMARIQITKGRLILDPREPSSEPAGAPRTF